MLSVIAVVLGAGVVRNIAQVSIKERGFPFRATKGNRFRGIVSFPNIPTPSQERRSDYLVGELHFSDGCFSVSWSEKGIINPACLIDLLK